MGSDKVIIKDLVNTKHIISEYNQLLAKLKDVTSQNCRN